MEPKGGLLSLKWNNHRSSFIHVLSSLRSKDSYCDVTIACEGKFYPSHKLVLSTCSEYFQEMFQHTDCKHPIIVLKDIRSEDLESLLNYMYIGEVNVLQEKLSTLIKAAECLRIKGLAVPDDAPPEKRSCSNDSTQESKRRKSDSDHHRNRESSRSHSKSSYKYTDSQYRQNPNNTESYAPPPRLPNNSTENENSINHYTGASDNPADKTKDNFEVCFVKSEPPDTYETEDTKEGILKKAPESYMSPLPQEEGSNSDALHPSASKEIWSSESTQADGYPPLDSTTDDPSAEEGPPPDDAEWEEERESQVVWNNDLIRRRGVKKETEDQYPATDEGSWRREYAQELKFSGDEKAWTSPEGYAAGRYQCSLCVKGFDHKGNYRKHLRTHTGERPFECPVCQYKATQKGNLQAHIKRRHPFSNCEVYECID